MCACVRNFRACCSNDLRSTHEANVARNCSRVWLLLCCMVVHTYIVTIRAHKRAILQRYLCNSWDPYFRRRCWIVSLLIRPFSFLTKNADSPLRKSLLHISSALHVQELLLSKRTTPQASNEYIRTYVVWFAAIVMSDRVSLLPIAVRTCEMPHVESYKQGIVHRARIVIDAWARAYAVLRTPGPAEFCSAKQLLWICAHVQRAHFSTCPRHLHVIVVRIFR